MNPVSEEKTPITEKQKKTSVQPARSPEQKVENKLREQEYHRACKIAGWTRWAVDYRERAELFYRAVEKFRVLGNYRDSARRAEKCLAAAKRAETEERDAAFRKALEEVEAAKTADDYFYAAQAMERFPDLPEAQTTAEQCMAKYHSLRRRDSWVRVAAAVLACILVVGGIIVSRSNAVQYGVARAYAAVGNYEKALGWYRRSDSFGDSEDRIAECRYRQATAAYEEGAYDKAYSVYRELGVYRGAQDRAAESLRAMLADSKAGTVVEFGERDNGKPAKWYVLENNGETVTLIAEFDLKHAFDSGKEPRTWADCELRTWLNTDFLTETFYKYEQDLLARPILPSEDSGYGTKGGADTVDQVYILSAKEVNDYKDVLNASDDQGEPLQIYNAGAHGWILRTPGAVENGVATVDQGGRINYYGYLQSSTQPRVRPVVQVDITD